MMAHPFGHESITFDEIVSNSEAFFVPIPTTNNQVATVVGDDQAKKTVVEEQARGTRIIILNRVLTLIGKFLDLKKSHGSQTERAVYQEMGVEAFVQRLFLKRPLVFCDGGDYTMFRDKLNGFYEEDWLLVGTDHERQIHLQEYLSYDEMQISALLGVSTPTYFINNGNRRNRAVPGESGTFEESGILIGLVGARFQQPGRMEHQHIIVSKSRSIPRNGYGDPTKWTFLDEVLQYVQRSKYARRVHDRKLLEIWAEFYNSGNGNAFYLPSYDEVVEDQNFVKMSQHREDGTLYFNVQVYMARMKVTAETLLLEASARGTEAERLVYLHVVGFGLGVWQVLPGQGAMVVQCFIEAIRSLDLPSISTVDFSWFPPEVEEVLQSGSTVKSRSDKEIKIVFSKRNTADKVDNGELLVATYAWNSNSFPGNDYWGGHLMTTSDPAAACCSTIPELQNPYINPFYSNMKILS